MPGAQRHLGLVGLDQRSKQRPFWIDHGPAQLVEQQPGGLVAAQANLRLSLLGGNAVGMARHQEPKRMIGRYIITNTIFFGLLFREIFRVKK
jgi:hypothetical protein